MSVELSFIFPTYDEDQNIFERLGEIECLKDLVNGNIEVIISDDTPSNFVLEERITKFLKFSELKIVYISRFKKQKKRGLAYSILDGLNVAKGNYICIADIDGQHNIFDAFSLYETSRKLGLITIGSRFKKGGAMSSKTHFLCSYVFNLWLIIITRVNCLDKTGGFSVIPRAILKKTILKRKEYIFKGYGDYFINLSRFLHINKIDFKEIPVFYRLRSSGYSKSNFSLMIIKYTLTALKASLNNNLYLYK